MDFTFEEFEELFDLEADREAARIADALLASDEEAESENELQAQLLTCGDFPGQLTMQEDNENV